jgi:hypothetical protein
MLHILCSWNSIVKKAKIKYRLYNVIHTRGVKLWISGSQGDDCKINCPLEYGAMLFDK